MLSWVCHACILHQHLAGKAAVTAAPTSSVNRSGSEPSGISQVVRIYSVVFIQSKGLISYTSEGIINSQSAQALAGEPTPTEEQSHQQKLSTNDWYGIVHDFLRG